MYPDSWVQDAINAAYLFIQQEHDPEYCDWFDQSICTCGALDYAQPVAVRMADLLIKIDQREERESDEALRALKARMVLRQAKQIHERQRQENAIVAKALHGAANMILELNGQLTLEFS